MQKGRSFFDERKKSPALIHLSKNLCNNDVVLKLTQVLWQVYSLPGCSLQIWGWGSNKELKQCIRYLYEKLVHDKLNHLEKITQKNVAWIIHNCIEKNIPVDTFTVVERFTFYTLFYCYKLVKLLNEFNTHYSFCLEFKDKMQNAGSKLSEKFTLQIMNEEYKQCIQFLYKKLATNQLKHLPFKIQEEIVLLIHKSIQQQIPESTLQAADRIAFYSILYPHFFASGIYFIFSASCTRKRYRLLRYRPIIVP